MKGYFMLTYLKENIFKTTIFILYMGVILLSCGCCCPAGNTDDMTGKEEKEGTEISGKVNEVTAGPTVNFVEKENVTIVTEVDVSKTPSEEEKEQAMKYFDEGTILFKEKKYREAIEFYDKAIELSPGFVDAWNNKGLCLKYEGYVEEGMKCFDKAIEMDPGYYMAWYNKANIFYDQNEYDEAIECYDKTLEIKPDHFKAWCNKGNMFYARKKYEEAIKCYDRALEIQPDDELSIENREKAMKALGK